MVHKTKRFMSATPTLALRTERSFFEYALGGAVSQYRNKQIIYSQGKAANTLFYIREGNVMLTVRSIGRRPAIITALGSGDFFGQSCIAGVRLRICTATAIGCCSILAIKSKEMIRVLRGDHVTANAFVSYLLSVIQKYQDHLTDLLVNSAEQRLVRVLLRLAEAGTNRGRIPKMSQEVLANMVGTTRSRTNFYLNRFRRQGFIAYDGEIVVRPSLRAAYLLE